MPDSFYVQQMGESKSFEQLLKKGQYIVEELKLEELTNTLARWMVHYLAELIEAAKSASGEKKEALKRQCADLIVKIWDLTGRTPYGLRPYEDFLYIRKLIEGFERSGRIMDGYFSKITYDESSPRLNEILSQAELLQSAMYEIASYYVNEAVLSISDKMEFLSDIDDGKTQELSRILKIIEESSQDKREIDKYLGVIEKIQEQLNTLSSVLRDKQSIVKDKN